MLHFDKMVLNNFGPYKGEQEIDFTDKSGVTIFWGKNGRGKTTLINAFRYAMYGIIPKRNGNSKPIFEMINTEALSEGSYELSVILRMTNDDDSYELTRKHILRQGVVQPKNDADYERRFYIQKNRSILSREAGEHEINAIIPEQISRFFLFDAELLEEYEELVDDKSENRERIKRAIEKILGMPVLQNANVDAASAFETYSKKYDIALRDDKRTVETGKAVANVKDSISKHGYAYDKFKEEIGELEERYSALEKDMQATVNLRKWLNEKKALERSLEIETGRLENQKASIRQCMKTAWKGMLNTQLRDMREHIEGRVNELEKKKEGSKVADRFIMAMRKAIADRVCPVCGQNIGKDIERTIQENLKRSNSEYSELTPSERMELESLKLRLSDLKSLENEESKTAVAAIEREINNSKTKIEEDKNKIEELKVDIGNNNSELSEEQLMELADEYSKVQISIGEKKRALDTEKSQIDEYKSRLNNLIKSINSSNAGEAVKNAKRQYDMCDKLCKILENGKNEYREHLKEQVEKDATEIFSQLTGDSDYVGLKINDNYGLNIVHRSGRLVPGRSSGYEHIVALSLIGALHKNAPLQGPIIMDSPFGRLDTVHRDNIIKALPNMAEQTMLLAHTGEIDEEGVRETLKDNLVNEFELKRESSMFTRICKR